MNSSRFPIPSRRQFLRTLGSGLAACALTRVAPAFASGKISARSPRTLILIQLDGGNDGFNTVAPFSNDAYFRARPTLALARNEVIPLSEISGLNRAAAPLLPIFNAGEMAVIQNVGYPLMSDSHFRSSEIWHTASTDDYAPTCGWGARCAAQNYYAAPLAPRIFSSELSTHAPQQLSTWNQRFDAQLAEIGTRAGLSDSNEIFFAALSGFDTHFDQATRHRERLVTLTTSLAALQQTLTERGVADRVLTVVFSEFNRSLAENAQGGTDHGHGGPVCLVGPAVVGGIHNEGHDLCDSSASDDAFIDFRRVIATVSDQWLGLARASIVDPSFAPSPVLQSKFIA
ncbi:DUF1501 domain-containing protein [Oleiharenicola lentus]|uniref:DUF1501 domain-containing protein n=1 Tax=Oleiharenicola lentus TaxID=2508720 RepID=UPI003F674EAA